MADWWVERWVNGHWVSWCKCYTKDSAEVCSKALSEAFDWRSRVIKR